MATIIVIVLVAMAGSAAQLKPEASPSPVALATSPATGMPSATLTTAATTTPEPKPEPTPLITPEPSSTPEPTAAPTQKPRVLLDLKGSGIRRSARFTTSGDWTISWSYNCASFYGGKGNFIITVQGNSMDVAANELGKKGSGTQPEYTGPGSFYLEMNSECTWRVVVRG